MNGANDQSLMTFISLLLAMPPLAHGFSGFYELIKNSKDETDEQLEEVAERIEMLEKDNLALSEFFESAYSYFGDQPNWKAQQEFRDLVSKNSMIHADAIDDYLGSLVDATRRCMIERGQSLDIPWDDLDQLEHYRGHRGWERKLPQQQSSER